MGCGYVGLIGTERLEPLRVSSAIRVRTKQLILEGKIIEVRPGVFQLSDWYKQDLELMRNLEEPETMAVKRLTRVLDNGGEVR